MFYKNALIINKNALIINKNVFIYLKIVCGKKITAVIGMMADKDIDKVLSMMTPYFDKVYTVTPSNPRAMDKDELCEKIKTHGTEAVSYELDKESLYKLIESLNEEEVLIVCGSLYLCSDVYNLIAFN